ncbi:hypothetical protein PR202_gb15962 [Eleusine coracana subsp. coracana]|uniref:Uncharacterized protein n=1 Tax=Eleusine coracana subsp. coracana TaxID=191504 RepID=A0AAV5EWV4_ELECO|nr:hypothetical protein PR202_gb15962 [Eleusine coracana subsp. coracana]
MLDKANAVMKIGHSSTKGNSSSFPGPVKFPSLTDLEKYGTPYPELPASLLQEVAIKRCSVPPEEETLELLEMESTMGETWSRRQ